MADYPLPTIMELLNLSFAILLFKICFCVLPGVLAVALMLSSEDHKRSWRNTICRSLLGVSNAISYSKFNRTLMVFGFLLLIYSITVTWFFIIKDQLAG